MKVFSQKTAANIHLPVHSCHSGSDRNGKNQTRMSTEVVTSRALLLIIVGKDCFK